MFNLSHDRLYYSFNRGVLQAAPGVEARGSDCFRFVPRKRHTTTSLLQTKIISQLEASL